MLPHLLFGIGVSVAALLLFAVAQVLLGVPAGSGDAMLVGLFLVIGCAIWAVKESRRLQFSSYAMSFPRRPPVAFALVSLMWVIGFPWFLATRRGVMRGTIRKLSGTSSQRVA
jgi:hypothetical protein